MGNCNLCSNVRPRYKIYVIGVFDGNIDDLCSFSKLYPNQLPRIGRYLLKQLNIRIQQNKSNIIHNDINLAMHAWNDLIFSCNSDIEKFESHILQSMILLFAQQSLQLHLLAMQTLRVYLPYSHKMSMDELLRFVDSCTLLADSQQIPVRIDALKTLSIIFTHLRSSPFCPDLYTKYDRIIRAILSNMATNCNNNENGKIENEKQCDIYGEHCYEQFCSLISTNTLSIMLSAMSSILTENYGWSPTKFVIKLFDILASKGSSIEAISIVQEILHILSNLQNGEDNANETFAEYIVRLNTMDSMIIALKEFSSRVLSKNSGTKINRNPILSKLCGLLHIIDEAAAKKDSLDISTEKILKFARNLLDCIQFYVVDISYIDSQSVLLRAMIKYLINSKSMIHTQLQLECMLRTLAHRTGTITLSQHTQGDIMKKLLNFHLKQQCVENNDLNIELLQLSIQNLILLSSNDDYLHEMGFNQTEWAINRVETFLESQIKYKINLSPTYYLSPTQSTTPLSSTSAASSSSPTHSHSTTRYLNLDVTGHGIGGFTVYKLPYYQREWLYATIYSYLQNATKQFTQYTLLHITYTIIIIAISPHNFKSNDKNKTITDEIIDFELLLPFLLSIQKLADSYSTENAIKDSVICHSIILSVLLYIRNFLHCSYAKKSNYRVLFHKFCQIVENVFLKCKQNNDIWSEFRINQSGLVTVSKHAVYDNNNDKQIQIFTNIMPFDDIIESLTMYFDLIAARRLSISTRTELWNQCDIKKAFPVTLILNNLCQEDVEAGLEGSLSLSAISQSILLTPSRMQHRYVHSAASFDDHFKFEDANQIKQSMTSLDTLQAFQEITQTYSENLDQINRIQLSVTGICTGFNNNANNYTMNAESSDNSFNIQTQTKSFNFEMPATTKSQHTDNDLFGSKQSVIESIEGQHAADLSHFYIEYENQANPTKILHNGLCNRLDLIDLDLGGNECAEHELNELNYEQYINQHQNHIIYINSNEHQNGNDYHEINEFKESPMRQLKAKGKSAVIQIRNRTRKLTQNMSVRNTQNAIRQKTKQGSKAIKEKFHNVKTKMFEQLKKEKERDIHIRTNVNVHKASLDTDNVQIELMDFAKPPNLNIAIQSNANIYAHTTKYGQTHTDYYDNYESGDDEISYTFSTEHSLSQTPQSNGSVNTI